MAILGARALGREECGVSSTGLRVRHPGPVSRAKLESLAAALTVLETLPRYTEEADLSPAEIDSESSYLEDMPRWFTASLAHPGDRDDWCDAVFARDWTVVDLRRTGPSTAEIRLAVSAWPTSFRALERVVRAWGGELA